LLTESFQSSNPMKSIPWVETKAIQENREVLVKMIIDPSGR